MTATPNRFDLYALCAQSPEMLVPLLRAIHDDDARMLGEDFCGAAHLSSAWVRLVPQGQAIAVDRDAEALEHICAADGLQVVHGDVVAATDSMHHAADVIHAGNFSICEWHGRAGLLNYLRHVRRRLTRRGLFTCDLYGGENAFEAGTTRQSLPGPGGAVVDYTWEQRHADPLTGMVENAMHFDVTTPDGGQAAFHDAFTYRWRLWTVPELRDAMHESGFGRVEVYPKLPDAVDEEGTALVEPLTADDLEGSFDVLVAGRT